MIRLGRVLPELPARDIEDALDAEPTKEEIREIVTQFRDEGLCGRRVAEDYLVPSFVASAQYGQREIDLLEDVLPEVYEDTDLCIRNRSSKCKRWRGGCQNSR